MVYSGAGVAAVGTAIATKGASRLISCAMGGKIGGKIANTLTKPFGNVMGKAIAVVGKSDQLVKVAKVGGKAIDKGVRSASGKYFKNVAK